MGNWLTIVNITGYLPTNIDAMPNFMATMFIFADFVKHFTEQSFIDEVL